MALEADTLERLIPDELESADVTGRETLRLHLERYEFAARHARPPRVLDLACGVGYGTHLVAARNAAVTGALGVDLSEEAIRYATERYGSPRVRFRVGDAMRFSDLAGFDTVVSLETVEHLPDPRAFFGRLVQLLRPGGVLVASVPTTPSVDVNPHHRHDFSEASFQALAAAHSLIELACLRQVQPFRPGRILRGAETRLADMRPNLLAYYAGHPGALARRLWATVRYGFENRYLTVAWRTTQSDARR